MNQAASKCLITIFHVIETADTFNRERPIYETFNRFSAEIQRGFECDSLQFVEMSLRASIHSNNVEKVHLQIDKKFRARI